LLIGQTSPDRDTSAVCLQVDFERNDADHAIIDAHPPKSTGVSPSRIEFGHQPLLQI
jgi:hypothetical protein